MIRKAAEIIGWSLESGRNDLFTDEDCLPWNPFDSRSDLHALVGLLEDKVREKRDLTMTLEPRRGHPYCVIFRPMRNMELSPEEQLMFDATNDDWLLAKLEALLKAVSDE